MVDIVSVRVKNARVEKMLLNIRIQWNAGIWKTKSTVKLYGWLAFYEAFSDCFQEGLPLC